MIQFELKYIIFDCYGMLIYFWMVEMVCEIYVDWLLLVVMEVFVCVFVVYWFDEVFGVWKLYCDVVVNVICCICVWVGVMFDEVEVELFYCVVLSWGLYLDVFVGLLWLVMKYKFVILLNVMDEQIMSNVDKFGVLFYVVFIVQQV